MTEFLDITATLKTVEIGATSVREIIQNVKTILSTFVNTVPLDRDFGVDPEYIDAPMPTNRALFNAEVVKKVQKYEPRVEVVRVLWNESLTEIVDGRVVPAVRIRIKEGVEF